MQHVRQDRDDIIFDDGFIIHCGTIMQNPATQSTVTPRLLTISKGAMIILSHIVSYRGLECGQRIFDYNGAVFSQYQHFLFYMDVLMGRSK